MTVRAGPGVAAFSAMVVLSLLASAMLRTREPVDDQKPIRRPPDEWSRLSPTRNRRAERHRRRTEASGPVDGTRRGACPARFPVVRVEHGRRRSERRGRSERVAAAGCGTYSGPVLLGKAWRAAGRLSVQFGASGLRRRPGDLAARVGEVTDVRVKPISRALSSRLRARTAAAFHAGRSVLDRCTRKSLTRGEAGLNHRQVNAVGLQADMSPAGTKRSRTARTLPRQECSAGSDAPTGGRGATGRTIGEGDLRLAHAFGQPQRNARCRYRGIKVGEVTRGRPRCAPAPCTPRSTIGGGTPLRNNSEVVERLQLRP